MSSLKDHGIRVSVQEPEENETRRSDEETSAEFPTLIHMQPLNKVEQMEPTSNAVNTSVDSGLNPSPASPRKNGKFTFPPSSAPSSPSISYRTTNNNISNLLIPPSGPLRRTLSARDLGTSSPKVRKNTIGSPQCIGSDYYGDSISAVNVSMGHADTSKTKPTTHHGISVLMSSIYSLFIFVLGTILFINDQHREHRQVSEIFSTCLAIAGVLWLVFFHIDLCKYKRQVLKQLKEHEDAMQEASERFSTATEFVFNSGYRFTRTCSTSVNDQHPPPYKFLQGRHSGSFFMKIGTAGFCLGYLVYHGLQLVPHVINFLDHAKEQYNCHRPSSIVFHTVIPFAAFYQLFIAFKYSNIVINRHKVIARFGLMHLMGTCLCNWFSTIVEEAVEDYNHKSGNSTGNDSRSEFDIASFRITVERREDWINPFYCSADSELTKQSMKAIPFLYPFGIEFNLLLFGIWFIVWQNIGKENINADPHHIRHTISQDEGGSEEVTYQSNLVMNVDCHSANKGLFIGLFMTLTIVITIFLFYIMISMEGYEEKAIVIHTTQEGILTIIGILVVCVSFYQTKKLDISEHPITFLDDVLLFIPLPFFFIHGIMSVIAEHANQNYVRLTMHILVTVQVMLQTPFIIDGLRRCSKSQSLRYKKPGKEIITFLLILNFCIFIVNTLEQKSVEHYHGQEEFYGDLIWMFIGHTTLPLMLFYRFHSTVCLSDIWKSAYQNET